MYRTFAFVALVMMLSCQSSDEQAGEARKFYAGADWSFYAEMRDHNVTYADHLGQTADPIELGKQNGMNIGRLRLWHSPPSMRSNLAEVKQTALKLKQQNMAFLLDIHYSDTWADPAHQTVPAAWENLTPDELKTAVYQYTKDVLLELKAQNTTPEFVQVGNETDSGFLWNHGRVWGAFEANWPNYAGLISRSIDAVREVAPKAGIILHYSTVEHAMAFFDKLGPFALDYDIIGLSYYPAFQTKDLSLVQTKINQLAAVHQKNIMIVETAYPFTLDYNDNANNIVGLPQQLIPGFPADANGQKLFVRQMLDLMRAVPDNRGIGVIYWAPDWVAFDGNQSTSTGGSAWENQALWDFEHKALPALDAFNP